MIPARQPSRALQREGPEATVELWQGHDGLWRWRFVETRTHTFLPSNLSYPTRPEALASAIASYPGVRVIQRPRPPGERRPALRRTWLAAMALASVLSAGLALLVVVAALKLAKLVQKGRHAARVASTLMDVGAAGRVMVGRPRRRRGVGHR